MHVAHVPGTIQKRKKEKKRKGGRKEDQPKKMNKIGGKKPCVEGAGDCHLVRDIRKKEREKERKKFNKVLKIFLFFKKGRVLESGSEL